MQMLFAPAAPAGKKSGSACTRPSGPNVISRASKHLVAVADRERGLLPGVAVLRQGDGGGDTRVPAKAFSATLTSSISTSCASSSRPNPTVCTGMRRLRRACSVSGAMPAPPSPAEFWLPSLSSTIAPTGRSEVSASKLLQAIVDMRGRARGRDALRAVHAA